MPQPPLPTAVALPLAAALALVPQVLAAAAAAVPAAVEELPALARGAASGDLDAARALRGFGPAGLSALVDAGVTAPGQGDDPRYRVALDLVCAQVDCHASRLYWHTDFAAARAAAGRSGMPILSLRLLGRLDEELSCANSRYFRTLLYSDPAIAAWLRRNVVLHWSSERPVPRVTVEYGDGRRLVGTVTGNSVHYLLDPRGRLVDALPGLHPPHRFLAWLESAAPLAGAWAALPDDVFHERLRREHARREAAVLDSLVAQLGALGWSAEAARAAFTDSDLDRGAATPPTAAEASALAVTKSRGEGELLGAVGLPVAPPRSAAELAIGQLVLSPPWRARLAAESRRLLLARAAPAVRDDLEAALLRLVLSLSEDGVRNEAFLHRRIHHRLVEAAALPDWRTFNAWVYAELFLTPASDPWLGLGPTELFSPLQPAD